MSKLESYFCDSIKSVNTVDAFNVAWSDVHDKHYGLTNTLNC